MNGPDPTLVINQNFDLNKSRQNFHHSLKSLKEHHKISNIPKFRCLTRIHNIHIMLLKDNCICTFIAVVYSFFFFMKNDHTHLNIFFPGRIAAKVDAMILPNYMTSD